MLLSLMLAPCIWITSNRSPLAMPAPPPLVAARTGMVVAPAAALPFPGKYVLITPVRVPPAGGAVELVQEVCWELAIAVNELFRVL